MKDLVGLARAVALPDTDLSPMFFEEEETLAPAYRRVRIEDKAVKDGKPVGPPHIISQRSGRGHSVRLATINGTKYALHSEESPFGAGFGRLASAAEGNAAGAGTEPGGAWPAMCPS